MANARSYIESWRLSRLFPQLTELGMVSQQDLLDLDPDDYKFIEMRPLEVGATCTNCRKLSPPCVVFIQYSTNIEGMPLLK